MRLGGTSKVAISALGDLGTLLLKILKYFRFFIVLILLCFSLKFNIPFSCEHNLSIMNFARFARSDWKISFHLEKCWKSGQMKRSHSIKVHFCFMSFWGLATDSHFSHPHPMQDCTIRKGIIFLPFCCGFLTSKKIWKIPHE